MPQRPSGPEGGEGRVLPAGLPAQGKTKGSLTRVGDAEEIDKTPETIGAEDSAFQPEVLSQQLEMGNPVI